MSRRQLLVLGNLKGAAMAALETACRDLGFESLLQQKADDAISQLDSGSYRALLVDLTTPGAARFCHEARARRALFNVPLIALSPKLTDLAFSNALRWGADDVVMLGAAEPLRARLQSIPEKVAPITAATRGEAVIADPERSRCDVLGRVLANAGFNVKYATDTVATRFYLTKDSVKLFVLNTELGDPNELIREARGAGNSADWVITTKTLDVDGIRAKLKGTPNVVVMSSHGPPENVLFALNLLRPSGDAHKRAEGRALYGAIVLFRPVGLDRDEFGFTYSVSSRGLYLRTLLEPSNERLWIEMTPPNVPRRVKLLAEVAWSRTFGEAGAETAPPGFGVRLLDGLGEDLELWRLGFESLEVGTPGGQEVSTSASSAFRVPLPSNRPPKQANRPSMVSIAAPRLSQTPRAAGATSPPKSRSVLPPSQISMLPGAAGATLTSRAATEPPHAAARQSQLPGRALVAHRSVRPKPSPSVMPQQAVVTPLAVRAVDVPSSTWASESESQREPLPRVPAGNSSQDAVLSAIRASLPPEAVAAVDKQRAQSLAARATRSGEVGLSGEHRAVSLPAPPSSVAQAQVADQAAADQAAAAQAAAPQAGEDDDTDPIPRLSRTAITEPIDPRIDYDDDVVLTPQSRAPGLLPEPQKHVRTVIGIGNPDRPRPADWSETDAPQAPPIGLADLDPLDAEDTTAPGVEGPSATTRQSTPVPEVPEASEPASGHTSLLRDADVESLPPPSAEAAGGSTAAGTPPTAPPPRRHRATQPEMATSTEAGDEELRTSPSHRRKKQGNTLRVALVAGAAAIAALLLGPRIYEQLRAGAASSANGASPEPLPAPRQELPVPVSSAQPSSGPNPADETDSSSDSVAAPSSQSLPPTDPSSSASAVTDDTAAEPVPTQDDVAAPGPERVDPAIFGRHPDLELLAEDQAYLFVRSAVSANVYVHGVEVGKTNTWLTSRCGFRFIRLGTAPGQWLSKGDPAKLNCKQANQLEIQ